MDSYNTALPWFCRQIGPFFLLSKKDSGLKYSLGASSAVTVVSSACVCLFAPATERQNLLLNPVTKFFLLENLAQLHSTQLSCHAFIQPTDSDPTSTTHPPSNKSFPGSRLSASSQAIRNFICTLWTVCASPNNTFSELLGREVHKHHENWTCYQGTESHQKHDPDEMQVILVPVHDSSKLHTAI